MNPIKQIQRWMHSPSGQIFMNYAYSWGAAIVILGTLFKLTHIPGANLMLFIGMGTEVFVFFISGFDISYETTPSKESEQAAPTVIPVSVSQPEVSAVSTEGVTSNTTTVVNPDALSTGAGLSIAAANLAAAGQAAAEAQRVLSTLNGEPRMVNGELVKATDPAEIEEAVKNYAEELTALTEVLSKVREQTSKMTTDSEEMENLNRTLTGIATVYELQLRNISKQVTTIEQIDEQTRRMAAQIEELNNVYARMIQALTVNMGAASVPPTSAQV